MYNRWPYGVQGIFIFLIPPYGVHGRCIIFGPLVYRNFFYFIPPFGVIGRCIIFGPMVYRAIIVMVIITPFGVNDRLHYSSLLCTGHGNFNLSDSTIQLDYRSGYRCSM